MFFGSHPLLVHIRNYGCAAEAYRRSSIGWCSSVSRDFRSAVRELFPIRPPFLGAKIVKKNRNINNNFVAFVFCGLTFHVFSQTHFCVVDWLGSYFVRFGSFGARRRSIADEPRSFSGEPQSYKSRREIYISRREMYIISAGNVHLPPRFITSWAAPKVCELCGKTSRASATVY